MGKGNRARADRAQEKLDRPQNYAAKKQAPKKWIVPLVLIIVAVFVVATLVFSALDNHGVFKRGTAAITSEHYTVNSSMMSYFFRNEYISFVNQYSSIVSYLGLNTSTSLKLQECRMLSNGGTWFDYFMSSASSYVQQLLTYCEEANARGITLSDENRASIDEAIKSMETSALSNGYTLKSYITAMYGAGVNESDIRSCLEIVYLASDCAEQLGDELEAQITEDDINKYFEEHKSTFIKADYVYVAFAASKAKDADEAAQKTYEEELAEIEKSAAEFAAIGNGAKFFEKVKEYYTNLYKGMYDSDDLTAEEIAAKEAKALADKLDEIVVTGHAYVDPTAEGTSDLDKWLFADGRKAGDTTTITKDEDSDSVSTHTIYVYSVQEPAYYDEYKSANIGYALYDATESDAETKANALKEKFEAGEKTAQALSDLAKAEGCTYYGTREDMVKDSFGMDELDDHLFNSHTLTGTCAVVKNDNYVVVVFYESEGDVAWYVTAKSGVLSDKVSEWYKAKNEALTITVNDKALSKVSG